MASFFKRNVHTETVKCKLDYHPVVPVPPNNNIVKWYMDNIVQIMGEIGAEKIFVYADDAINNTIVMVM